MPPFSSQPVPERRGTVTTLSVGNAEISDDASNPGGELSENERLLFEYLQQFVTDRRKQRFADILAQRTRFVTIVLENLYQEHNISAVLRTCDAFGVQDISVIEREFPYSVNRQVALGTDQWLTIRRFAGPSPTIDSLHDLRSRGYRLVATTPQPGSLPIEELPLDRPLALIMGNEIDGLSPEAVGMADLYGHIPMFGFVESFNISVAAALCMQTLVRRIRESVPSWGLSDVEKRRLTFNWVRQSVANVNAIEARFWRDRAKSEA